MSGLVRMGLCSSWATLAPSTFRSIMGGPGAAGMAVGASRRHPLRGGVPTAPAPWLSALLSLRPGPAAIGGRSFITTAASRAGAPGPALRHHGEQGHHTPAEAGPEPEEASTLAPPWLLGLGILLGSTGLVWGMLEQRAKAAGSVQGRVAVLEDGLLQLAVDVQEAAEPGAERPAPVIVSTAAVADTATSATASAPSHPAKGLSDLAIAAPPPEPHASTKSSATKSTSTSPTPASTTTQQQQQIPHVDYVLIGAGTASHHAAEAIRAIDPQADVLIIGVELHAPYSRPPLSKELWFSEHQQTAADPDALVFTDWTGKEQHLFYHPKADYHLVTPAQMATPSTKVKLLPSTVVERLDPETQVIQLLGGRTLHYSKVLLATGGRPKFLAAFGTLPPQARSQVMVYRTVEHFQHLAHLAQAGKTIAIVGGGFLGSELAAALSTRPCRTVQIYPDEGNMSNVFPKYLTNWTRRALIGLGVEVQAGATITSVSYGPDAKIHLKLQPSGTVASVDAPTGSAAATATSATQLEEVVADVVVLATGLEPNTAIAQLSQLELDPTAGGILVNADLEARANVFVAGDVSSYHDQVLGRRRVEHYDHAVHSGRRAGENMAGVKRAYQHLPMFWSDLGPKISYEAVGLVSSKYKTVSIWAKPKANGDAKADAKEGVEDYHKGVVYYLSPEQQVVGVLFWNAPGRMEEARALLRARRRIREPRDLVGVFKL